MQRDALLAIETSNPSSWAPGLPAAPGVALARLVNGAPELLGVEPVDVAARDDDLMLRIEALTARFGIAPRRLASVAVSVGPGGFTSVRIAVTTARLIAEATGAACHAVPSALVAAARAPRGRPFAVALASKGQTAFLTRFGADGRALDAGSLVDAGAVSSADFALLIADKFLPESWQAAAHARGMRIEPPVFDPAACLEVGRSLPASDPLDVLPIYPREPEAVTKWRLLHPPKS